MPHVGWLTNCNPYIPSHGHIAEQKLHPPICFTMHHRYCNTVWKKPSVLWTFYDEYDSNQTNNHMFSLWVGRDDFTSLSNEPWNILKASYLRTTDHFEDVTLVNQGPFSRRHTCEHNTILMTSYLWTKDHFEDATLANRGPFWRRHTCEPRTILKKSYLWT